MLGFLYFLEICRDNELANIIEEKREWLWRQGASFIVADHHYKLYLIGPNDMDLCRRLIIGGGEHRKFLRKKIHGKVRSATAICGG